MTFYSTLSLAMPQEADKISSSRWNYVGKPDFIGNKSLGYLGLKTYSMAVTSNGIPYLAILFETNRRNFQILATQYNPVTHQWDSLKNFSTYSMNNINIAVDPAGVPYIAHIGNGKQIVVMKYDMQQQQWVSLGSVASTSGVFDLGLKIIFDQAGVPYLIYGTNSKKIFVMKYTGKAWLPIQKYISPQGEIIGNPKMVITQTGKIYIAFISTNGQYQSIKVATLTDKGWQLVAKEGLPSFASYSGSLNDQPISLALDNNGNPYLAYIDFSFLQAASLIKFSGKAWKPVGKYNFTPAFVKEINLVLDSHNTPYLAFTYLNDTFLTRGLMKFDGKDWINDASLQPLSPTDNLMRLFFKMTPDNKLYLGYGRCVNKARDDCSMNVLNRQYI